jgi:hypothetical protein
MGAQYPLESWLEQHAADMDAKLERKIRASTGDQSRAIQSVASWHTDSSPRLLRRKYGKHKMVKYMDISR